ncbi:MAG: putative nucleotidyltransferase substrate binding domain-containing protein [Abditibacteriaceae bacterium]
MLTFAELFQSSNSAQTLHSRLEVTGFQEIKEAASKPKSTFTNATRKSTFIQSAPQRAEKLLRSLASDDADTKVLLSCIDELIHDLSHSVDPMRALLNLSRLSDAVEDRSTFLSLLSTNEKIRKRICHLLAFSQAVAETLLREPAFISQLEEDIVPPSRAHLRKWIQQIVDPLFLGNIEDIVSANEKVFDRIRHFRHQETARIAVFDMELSTWRNEKDFTQVVHWISDLASVCVQEVWRVLSDSKPLPFTVLAMGKLGARELNYSSDIDLIFLSDAESEQSIELDKLGQQLIKVLSDGDAIWRVDMQLRPEGKSGALVTNLNYALSYYESFAAPWEWQAQIKARAIAGDARIARRFLRFMRGVIWARRQGDAHLRDMIEMKRRSEALHEKENERNIKSGSGGIRDAEWVIQQLQMMVGSEHPQARRPATLQAMKQLQNLEVLTVDEARVLREGYLFLRVVEHRLQILDEQAVRLLPETNAALAALARRMGSHLRGGAAARWLLEEHAQIRHQVRELCEHLFWGWHGSEFSTTEDLSLDKFYDLTSDAPTRLQRMSEGSTSAPFPAPLARQIKVAMSPVLDQLDNAADTTRALINLERLCDASGNRLSLLRSLGGTASLGRAVCTILGGSDALSDTLIRFPELLDMAAQRGMFAEGVTRESARADCRSYCLNFRDHRAAVRRWMAREMLRVGLRDLVLETPPLQICAEISHLTGAAIEFATVEIQQELLPRSQQMAFTVIGMGKFGGAEMHYSSDADVVFAHEIFAPVGDAGGLANQWASGVMRYLDELTPEGRVIELDPRLRPEGRSGMLAPTLETYFYYLENSTEIWERQALTRARPAAGNREVAAKLMAAIREVVFPKQWHSHWSDELRHIKSRMESERAVSGKSTFDVKLGAGGISDVEWCAQWIAMKYGHAYPQLQTPSTWDQLLGAAEAKVLSQEQVHALCEAYQFLRRAELRRQIVHRRSENVVKKDSRDFIVWARSMFPDEPEDVACEKFEECWTRYTVAVRSIFEIVREEL